MKKFEEAHYDTTIAFFESAKQLLNNKQHLPSSMVQFFQNHGLKKELLTINMIQLIINILNEWETEGTQWFHFDESKSDESENEQNDSDNEVGE